MQVVSGPVGRERVHFEAPVGATAAPPRCAGLSSGSTPITSVEPVLKAALAHLWFVTIHPFDDGNGRIARAIADMALARSEESPRRFYSMSAQIRQERADYYRILERTQKGYDGHHPVDGVVPRLPDARDRGRACHVVWGNREGARVGEAARRAIERSSAAHDQPPDRRLRRQAHDLEVGRANEDLRQTPHSATYSSSSNKES